MAFKLEGRVTGRAEIVDGNGVTRSYIKGR